MRAVCFLQLALLVVSPSSILSELLSAEDKTWLESVLKKQEEDTNVKEITKFNVSFAENPLYTLSHESVRVELETELNHGGEWNHSLIITRLPGSSDRQQMVNNTGIFKNDILVHEEVLPHLEQLMGEFKDRSIWPWPKMEGRKDDFSAYIREDIEADGYSQVNSLAGLDFEQCKIALATLAKFHAMTCVIDERGLLRTDLFNESSFTTNFDLLKPYYMTVYSDLAKFIEQNKTGDDWQVIAKRLDAKSKTIAEDLKKIIEGYSLFDVLNHGTYNIKSIYFKYSITDVYESDDPIAAKMSNFYLSAYTTPAHDLQYFMNTSPYIGILEEEKDRSILIKTYHEALKKYLKKFGYKLNIPTLDEIKSEVERYELVGITVAIHRLPGLLLTKELAEDLRKEIERVSKLEGKGKYAKMGYSEEYLHNIKILLERAIKKNIL